jgi:hypothetical protein
MVEEDMIDDNVKVMKFQYKCNKISVLAVLCPLGILIYYLIFEVKFFTEKSKFS